jgi:hypothetical protein
MMANFMIRERVQSIRRESQPQWLLLASICTLLTSITALGVCVVFPAYKKQEAIAEVLRLGGNVQMEERGPAWLRSIIGKERARGFDEIIQVNLRSSSGFGDADMQVFDWLDVRDSVSLSWTRITDRGLVHLGSNIRLKKLNLTATHITAAGLTHLGGLTNLRELNICQTSVTDDGLSMLAGLTQLVHLAASETAFGNTGLMYLSELGQLEWLDLAYSEITDGGLRHLGRSSHLESLNIEGTHITDAGLKSIKGLKQLRNLDVSHTQVTEVGLWHLQGIVELAGVRAFATRVDSDGEEIKRLTWRLPFTTFSFEDNRFKVGVHSRRHQR